MQKLFTISAEDVLKKGLGTGLYSDIISPFSDLSGLNPFRNPGFLSENYPATQIGSGVIADTIKWFSGYGGVYTFLFAYGNLGKIYRINTATQACELLRTVSNSSGQGLAYFKGALYYAQNTQLGKATNLDNVSPTFTDNFGTGLNDNNFHKLYEFQGRLYIANKNVVSYTDGTTLTLTGARTLTLPDDYEINSLTDNGYYLVIGATKKQGGFTNNISKIFFWNTITPDTVDYEVEVMDGTLQTLSKTSLGVLAFTLQGIYPVGVGTLGAPILTSIVGGSLTATDLIPTNSGVYSWNGMTIWKANNRILCYGNISPQLPNILTSPFILTNIAAIYGASTANVYASTSDNKLYLFSTGSQPNATLSTALIEAKGFYQINKVKAILGNPFATGDSLQIQLTNENYGTVSTASDITISYTSDGGVKHSFIKPIFLEGNYIRLILTFNGGINLKRIEFYGDYTNQEKTI